MNKDITISITQNDDLILSATITQCGGAPASAGLDGAMPRFLLSYKDFLYNCRAHYIFYKNILEKSGNFLITFFQYHFANVSKMIQTPCFNAYLFDI